MKTDKRDKSVVISTRITVEQYEQIEALAKYEGLRPSEFIRDILKKLLKKVGAK